MVGEKVTGRALLTKSRHVSLPKGEARQKSYVESTLQLCSTERTYIVSLQILEPKALQHGAISEPKSHCQSPLTPGLPLWSTYSQHSTSLMTTPIVEGASQQMPHPKYYIYLAAWVAILSILPVVLKPKKLVPITTYTPYPKPWLQMTNLPGKWIIVLNKTKATMGYRLIFHWKKPPLWLLAYKVLQKTYPTNVQISN